MLVRGVRATASAARLLAAAVAAAGARRVALSSGLPQQQQQHEAVSTTHAEEAPLVRALAAQSRRLEGVRAGAGVNRRHAEQEASGVIISLARLARNFKGHSHEERRRAFEEMVNAFVEVSAVLKLSVSADALLYGFRAAASQRQVASSIAWYFMDVLMDKIDTSKKKKKKKNKEKSEPGAKATAAAVDDAVKEEKRVSVVTRDRMITLALRIFVRNGDEGAILRLFGLLNDRSVTLPRTVFEDVLENTKSTGNMQIPILFINQIERQGDVPSPDMLTLVLMMRLNGPHADVEGVGDLLDQLLERYDVELMHEQCAALMLLANRRLMESFAVDVYRQLRARIPAGEPTPPVVHVLALEALALDMTRDPITDAGDVRLRELEYELTHSPWDSPFRPNNELRPGVFGHVHLRKHLRDLQGKLQAAWAAIAEPALRKEVGVRLMKATRPYQYLHLPDAMVNDIAQLVLDMDGFAEAMDVRLLGGSDMLLDRRTHAYGLALIRGHFYRQRPFNAHVPFADTDGKRAESVPATVDECRTFQDFDGFIRLRSWHSKSNVAEIVRAHNAMVARGIDPSEPLLNALVIGVACEGDVMPYPPTLMSAIAACEFYKHPSFDRSIYAELGDSLMALGAFKVAKRVPHVMGRTAVARSFVRLNRTAEAFAVIADAFDEGLVSKRDLSLAFSGALNGTLWRVLDDMHVPGVQPPPPEEARDEDLPLEVRDMWTHLPTPPEVVPTPTDVPRPPARSLVQDMLWNLEAKNPGETTVRFVDTIGQSVRDLLDAARECGDAERCEMMRFAVLEGACIMSLHSRRREMGLSYLEHRLTPSAPGGQVPPLQGFVLRAMRGRHKRNHIETASGFLRYVQRLREGPQEKGTPYVRDPTAFLARLAEAWGRRLPNTALETMLADGMRVCLDTGSGEYLATVVDCMDVMGRRMPAHVIKGIVEGLVEVGLYDEALTFFCDRRSKFPPHEWRNVLAPSEAYNPTRGERPVDHSGAVMAQNFAPGVIKAFHRSAEARKRPVDVLERIYAEMMHPNMPHRVPASMLLNIAVTFAEGGLFELAARVVKEQNIHLGSEGCRTSYANRLLFLFLEADLKAGGSASKGAEPLSLELYYMHFADDSTPGKATNMPSELALERSVSLRRELARRRCHVDLLRVALRSGKGVPVLEDLLQRMAANVPDEWPPQHVLQSEDLVGVSIERLLELVRVLDKSMAANRVKDVMKGIIRLLSRLEWADAVEFFELALEAGLVKRRILFSTFWSECLKQHDVRAALRILPRVPDYMLAPGATYFEALLSVFLEASPEKAPTPISAADKEDLLSLTSKFANDALSGSSAHGHSEDGEARRWLDARRALVSMQCTAVLAKFGRPDIALQTLLDAQEAAFAPLLTVKRAALVLRKAARIVAAPDYPAQGEERDRLAAALDKLMGSVPNRRPGTKEEKQEDEEQKEEEMEKE